jgi:DNA-binding Lrp family transcriptional regulator
MKQNNGIINLDLKDRKILAELDFDARMPYSLLAKKVGLSKQSVENRISNLLKSGVIKGFYPVINVPKLGYSYCRLALTLQNITKEKKNEIIKYLNEHPRVFWLFDMQGIFDIFLVVWAKSLNEFRIFVEEIESLFGEYIKRKVENIATDVIHLPHRYLYDNKSKFEIHIAETNERLEIDELDRKILRCLCRNARIPIVDISREVEESAKVVAYRIRRLEDKRLIEAYRPIINHSLIGFTYYKLFISLNNISEESLKKLKSYIRNNPFLIYIIEGIALHADLDIELMIKSNKELFDFMEDLRFKFPSLIGEYQTVIFMNSYKVEYLPF